MNDWFEDLRVEKAEELSFLAERDERAGRLADAVWRYREAGQAFGAVAVSTPSDHPKTRTALGVAGVTCLARAGDFQQARALARRLLAWTPALTVDGVGELTAFLACAPGPAVDPTGSGQAPQALAGPSRSRLRDAVLSRQQTPRRAA